MLNFLLQADAVRETENQIMEEYKARIFCSRRPCLIIVL
jgi:hypothetical protein